MHAVGCCWFFGISESDFDSKIMVACAETCGLDIWEQGWVGAANSSFVDD